MPFVNGRAPQVVKTPEALAISDFVIGFNSSVVLDAALVGNRSVFLIPNDEATKFNHFAIDEGLVPKVSDYDGLTTFLRSKSSEYFNSKGLEYKTGADLKREIGYPDQSSTTLIANCLSKWME